MSDRHLALIVEDDGATAEDLTQLAASMGCDSMPTDNHQDALRLLGEHRFCIVLLDLEIKQAPDSIKGHRVFGTSLLREVRTRYGGNRGAPFWLPIIVISGHANDVNAVINMMKNGADDIIRKPLDLTDIEVRIRKVLQSAGRSTHESCAAAAPQAGEKTNFVLRITGEVDGRRANIAIANQKAPLTASAMKVLLHLAVAHQRRELVDKRVLGAKPNEGFRAISRLREQLRPALGDLEIVANDSHGGYSLIPETLVVECNVEALKALRDAEIDRLSAELSALLANR